MPEIVVTEDTIPVLYRDKEVGFCRRDSIDLNSGKIVGEIILNPGVTLPSKSIFVSIGWKGDVTEEQVSSLSKENIDHLTINRG